jgi:hypothetical protein
MRRTIIKPLKQRIEPLLGNSFFDTSFSHQIRQAILKETFSVQSVPELYNENQYFSGHLTRVEAGSNASTVALRVVGGDGKGTQCLGYNRATLESKTQSRVTQTRHNIERERRKQHMLFSTVLRVYVIIYFLHLPPSALLSNIFFSHPDLFHSNHASSQSLQTPSGNIIYFYVIISILGMRNIG